jgi:hypothetical protein
MGIFARSLYVSRKNDPHRSSATPAAIFTTAISRSERICSISRKEHLISDSLNLAEKQFQKRTARNRRHFALL